MTWLVLLLVVFKELSDSHAHGIFQTTVNGEGGKTRKDDCNKKSIPVLVFGLLMVHNDSNRRPSPTTINKVFGLDLHSIAVSKILWAIIWPNKMVFVFLLFRCVKKEKA